MPKITFATPPGRLSLLQPSQSSSSSYEGSPAEAPVSPKSILPAAKRGTEPSPLVFSKRTILSPSAEASDATRSEPRVSSALFAAEAASKKSLLSDVLASTPLSAPVRNQGILRRGSEATLLAEQVDTERSDHRAQTAAARPKLHFQEPVRSVQTSCAFVEDSVAQDGSVRKQKYNTAAPLALAAKAVSPKKRSLTIQEHAEVIERAAERAARQAELPKIDQAHGNATDSVSRQHGVPSAAEENLVLDARIGTRSNSRDSSIPTSPSLGSTSTDQQDTDGESTFPLGISQGAPILTPLSPKSSVQQILLYGPTAAAAAARPVSKISFAAVTVHPDREPHKLEEVESETRHQTEPLAKIEQSPPASEHPLRRAYSEDDGDDVAAPPKLPFDRRALSFSFCPKPDHGRSPHAVRAKKKLSASPAPQALPYQQRLRGIRGSDPIRSPAPRDQIRLTDTGSDAEDEVSDGSGYSEDEEDSSDDSEDQSEGVGNISDDADDQSVASGSAGVGISERDQYLKKLRSKADILQQLRSDAASGHVGTATAPGAEVLTAQRLQVEELPSSHPICFLPDTFEDSVPATPAELDSDTNERPPSSAKLGWATGSATSSRRPSYQLLHDSLYRTQSQMDSSAGEAEPISMPPFRRARNSVQYQSVMSDGEPSASSIKNVSHRETGLPSSLPRNASDSTSPAAKQESSGYRSPPSSIWRHVPTMQVPDTRKGSALRRSSHSIEPSTTRSNFSSPVGSMSSRLASSYFVGASRPTLKQRAVSVAAPARSQASLALCSSDAVSRATSPSQETAFSHLKSYLASPPAQPASGSRSPGSGSDGVGAGWTSDGQAPGLGISRYLTERLSSLAQTMTDEISHVGNVVLGYEAKPATHSSSVAEEPVLRHERAHTAPLERYYDASTSLESVPDRSEAAPTAPKPSTQVRPFSKPIRISTFTGVSTDWNSDRDGEAPAPRPNTRRSKTSGQPL